MEKYVLAGFLLIIAHLSHAGIFQQSTENIAGGSQIYDDNGPPEEMLRYHYRSTDSRVDSYE